MYSPSKRVVVTKCVTPELEKLGRALAGGNIRSICRAVFSNNSLRDEVVNRVCRMADEECSNMCSKRNECVSMFRTISLKQTDDFQWSELIHEFQTKAPTLHSILCSVISHTAARNKIKKV